MRILRRRDWENLIVTIVHELELNAITYHLDASTALFAQGVMFDMDDLDVTVKWGCIEEAREVFKEYGPTQITTSIPHSFKFKVGEMSVHVTTYQSTTGIGKESERIITEVLGRPVWSKTVDFYHKHMQPDHPLWDAVNNYLENRKIDASKASEHA